MNKKFFTLLAGTFLMFAAVFSVNAQAATVGHGLWDQSRLKLADPVKGLGLGTNSGYYHLKVDSVQSVTGASLRAGLGLTMNDSIVLFMGKDQGGGVYNLFVDTLNQAIANNSTEFKGNSKAEASAASLWCVTVNEYAQGQNPTYDFVNKEQGVLLDANLYGYESWARDVFTYDNTAPKVTARVGGNTVPGGISGWQFSLPFLTLDSLKPLVSYISTGSDTVAVLCIDTLLDLDPAAPGVASVVVKIASAADVKNGKVEGVLYFTLTEAAPFIINEEDFNTTFGRKVGATRGQLSFDPGVAAGGNPFADNALTAEYITGGESGLRIRPTTTHTTYPNWTGSSLYNHPAKPLGDGGLPTNFWSMNGTMFEIDTVFGTVLDSLGYLRLKKGNQYLEVATAYFEGNVSNNRFLKFGLRNSGSGYPATPSLSDSVLFAQSAFRMVYYPSGDSIYINSYQGTYLPEYNTAAMNMFGLSAGGWRDSVTQAVFTYWADTAALQNPDSAGWRVTPTLDDTLAMVTARLKHGRNPIYDGLTTGFLDPYTYYHRLLVALQDLTGGPRVTLHTNNSIKNDAQINTRINFNIYKPCDKVGQDLATVAAELYLIRNEKGEYLHVPLHSDDDSASWAPLDPNVHPELLPSYQWVVEKRYPSSPTSQIIFTNREFGWLDYEAQLKVAGGQPFDFRAKHHKFNIEAINAETVKFDDRNSTGNTTKTFIALKKEHKTDPIMGYTWIDPDTAVVSVYALQYYTKLAPNQFYLGTSNNFPLDTFIYGDRQGKFEKMYFALDTIEGLGYGNLLPYGYEVTAKTQVADLVTLVRQPYRLAYKDPFKMTCVLPLSITNGIDDTYALRPKGAYREIFGKPAFYLRHMYHDGKELEPCFALVQRIDTTTWNQGGTTPTKDMFAKYLTDKYSAQVAALIMGRLDDPNTDRTFNEGLFVASVDDGDSKLKAALRIGATRSSVFKRERDDDPIYRRFNTTNEGTYANDNPDTVHFHTQLNTNRLLFENTGAIPSQHKYWKYTENGIAGELGGKNYLGVVSNMENPTARTAIYVDTAYINRGTGYIKPQYLLMVDPRPIADGMGCDDDGNLTIPLPGYLRGRYLINAHDSASVATNGTGKIDYSYLWKTTWTRLVFTDAIHVNDHLYILGEYGSYENLEKLGLLTNRSGQTAKVVDITALHNYATSVAGKDKIRAIYLGTNTHKDCVFQFRLVERGSNDFLIESQTSDRDTINGPMIAPCEGGWIKEDVHDVPTISTSDNYMNIGQGGLWNVYLPNKEGFNPNPTNNENVVKVSVSGNIGSVSILNAAGKKVVINNILGQTVTAKTLTSDDEVVAAPRGVVIVSIGDEETFKTLVK